VAAQERYSVSRGRAAGPGDPELLILRDALSGMEAAIAPSKGGELASLTVNRVELIYLGRDYRPRSGFAGKAMFLWPATGPVVNTQWTVNGKTHRMPFHGFAKDADWRVVEHKASSKGAIAKLRWTDTPETREMYPFGFSLTVAYELAKGRLSIRYTVDAAPGNQGAMPFAIGNHVAFNLPPSGKGSAAKVLFETNCRDEILRDKASLPTGEIRPWRYAPSTAIGEFQAVPAVSLANCGTEALARLKDPGGFLIEVRHQADHRLPKMPVVQYNLYGSAAEGYFSPEPWIGLQGGLNSGNGLTRLTPGGTWNWRIEIRASPAPPSLRP
jgi:galactose mutarotase-like enzyme